MGQVRRIEFNRRARMYMSRRLLLVFGLLLCSVVIVFLVEVLLAPPPALGTPVGAWLTTSDGSNQLTQQANLNFASDSQAADSSTIDVNEYQKLQQMDGFGAAVTDSSAWLISTKMSAPQRSNLLKRLFDPVHGINISFVRIPMGASDFSVHGPYSYDDLPPGQTDPTLAKFSI